MTRFAKILIVIVALGSLGIAGFAAALRVGGPNWDAIAQSPEMSPHVSITRNDGGQYTGTMRVSGEQVGSSLNQAEVVVKAQQKILADLRAKIADLQPKVEALGPQSAAVADVNQKDITGLETHAEMWSQQLQTLSQEVAKLTAELSSKASQNTQIQQELGERRFEVLRLRNQLELLRDDVYAAEAQRNALERELVLLEENRKRLEQRQAQLKDQLGAENYSGPK